MNLSTYIAVKLFKSKKAKSQYSRFSVTAIITATIAVIIPIIVLSVMNGFQESTQNKIVGALFHLRLYSKLGFIENYQQILKQIKSIPEVKAAIPFFETQGILKSQTDTQWVIVKAYPPEAVTSNPYFKKNYKKRTISLEGKRKYVDFSPKDFSKNGIFLGEALADDLELYLGSKAKLLIPESAEELDVNAAASLKVRGIYSAGFAEYDKYMVIIPLKTLITSFDLENAVTGIGIILNSINSINKVEAKLKTLLKDPELYTENTLKHSIFKDFAKERSLMTAMLAFLMLATFLIVYVSMYVTVANKRHEIAIMKAIGIPTKTIIIAFILQGAIIGIVGGMLGTGIGVGITLSLTKIVRGVEWSVNSLNNLLHFMNGKFEIMPSDVFYLTQFPYKIQIQDITTTFLSAIIAALIGAIFPALKHGRLRPAEVLHNIGPRV